MEVFRLTRAKEGSLTHRRKELDLRPICPVHLFSLPSMEQKELGREIQDYATRKASELPNRPDRVFYDADAFGVRSSPTDDSWVYGIALQFYEERREK